LTAPPEDFVLTIARPGQVIWNDRVLDLTTLEKELRAARDRYADQGVVIRGDAALHYQDLADVLSTCDAAGIRNVRLPVRARASAPAPSGSPG
jgi:biopolymer transport protein ExbD